MAVISELMQSYDQSDSVDMWVAEGIHSITPSDTPLQLILPKLQVGAIKAEWIEDQLTGLSSHLEATCAATDTATIDVHTGDGADKFLDDVDTVIRVDQEYMLVTAVATDKLTVTRGYASTTAAVHSANAVVHIVSQVEHEGADGKKAIAQARTKPSNYVQTFSRTVQASGVQDAVKKLGGITSEVDYQVMQAMRQLALELEKTLIMGVASQVGNGSSTYRTMGGLWAMVATNRTSDSGAVDTDALEADIKTIWDAGGVPRAIVCCGAMAQAISTLYASRIVSDVNTTIGGHGVTSIINPLGAGPIAIIPHRLMANGEYFMLDTAKIGLGYIRPFHMKPLASDGDSEKRWIGGDYTLELLNETAHAYRYGLN
jgi:hypothetical protein